MSVLLYRACITILLRAPILINQSIFQWPKQPRPTAKDVHLRTQSGPADQSFEALLSHHFLPFRRHDSFKAPFIRCSKHYLAAWAVQCPHLRPLNVMAMYSKNVPFLAVCKDIVGLIGHHGGFGNEECSLLAGKNLEVQPWARCMCVEMVLQCRDECTRVREDALSDSLIPVRQVSDQSNTHKNRLTASAQ